MYCVENPHLIHQINKVKLGPLKYIWEHPNFDINRIYAGWKIADTIPKELLPKVKIIVPDNYDYDEIPNIFKTPQMLKRHSYQRRGGP